MEKIIELTNKLGGKVMFDTPVVVKSSPHTHIVSVYGVEVNKNHVYLLTGDGEWNQLEWTDRNYDYVANSLIQRLRYIQLTPLLNESL